MKIEMLEIVKIQNERNKQYDLNWRRAGKNWNQRIWAECAEMLSLYGLKWGRDRACRPELDDSGMKYVRLKIVKLWGLMLSQLIERHDTEEEVAHRLLRKYGYRLCEGSILSSLEWIARVTVTSEDPIISGLFGLMEDAGMPFDELYRTYIGKSDLNNFLQEYNDPCKGLRRALVDIYFLERRDGI